ncbi:MAG: bifunctional alpha,alpha-trehalose-phosphate synthase (UDP-forming)/trehalose-phosphatase [Candidatus Peribacteraceae bacterium]|nr:bifunctional alpha,alpha-trehalose-phosphate synthase (UDP-forming)/trehalose-phosphatase [Candidatus Peribacteraceae bacterium]
MGKIYIVSNRLPVSLGRRRGTLRFIPSLGGLATAIERFHLGRKDSVWVGWPGMAQERLSRRERERAEEELAVRRYVPVFLSEEEIDAYYNGFCNAVLWPLFHYFPQYAQFREDSWRAYRRANDVFAARLLRDLQEDDTVWIHDFHLFLLPALLRAKLPRLSIGFFLHVPFPSFEIFRLLPWRAEILEGILGADLIGFHTFDYVLHFLRSVQHVLGMEHGFGRMMVGDRVVRADAFPLGIDFDQWATGVRDPRVQEEVRALRRRIGEGKVILSIDRLDYTKGVPQRLRAFQELLRRHPSYRGKVTLLLVAPLSRTRVREYRAMKEEIDELTGAINGAFGTLEWTPVLYLTRPMEFRSLLALYATADAALVTPIRDGMNLIAKEYLASKVTNRGVLILSDMAGAANELSEAVLVNPLFQESLVNGMLQALSLTPREQIRRNKLMRESLRRRTASAWAQRFLGELGEVKEEQTSASGARLTPANRSILLRSFRSAARRLLFLDYDGTLVPFKDRPERAKPSIALRQLLQRLAKQATVVVASGRPRSFLQRTLGSLPIDLIAEHGAWVREHGGEWIQTQPLMADWKDRVRDILEQFVDGTPGSFIEEKDFSLVWHMRTVDPDLRAVRTKDLLNILRDLARNLPVDVYEGNRIVEVKNTGVDKGSAARRWLEKETWDFTFAAGDDPTDEYLFGVMPAESFLLKVGVGPSKAGTYVPSHRDIIALLKEMGREG